MAKQRIQETEVKQTNRVHLRKAIDKQAIMSGMNLQGQNVIQQRREQIVYKLL
jgi:hypothetical protein